MNFKNFKLKMQEHVAHMIQDATHLYEVDVDKDAFWNLYLDSFPAGTSNIYRERREHDCSCCRHFIRDIGNMVVIKDNHIQTIWGFDTQSSTYQPVADALDAYLKARVVTDRYFTKLAKIGTDSNKELIDDKVHTWEHFYLELPARFVDHTGRSEGDVKNEFRTAKQVFKRSLEEISMEALDTVGRVLMDRKFINENCKRCWSGLEVFGLWCFESKTEENGMKLKNPTLFEKGYHLRPKQQRKIGKEEL